MATEKKKTAKPAPAPTVREKVKQEPKFGVPIDTEKLRVEVHGTSITYFLKGTNETFEKDYENIHAVMIIYGRISRDPHGAYTAACIGKIRARDMKRTPL